MVAVGLIFSSNLTNLSLRPSSSVNWNDLWVLLPVQLENMFFFLPGS
jgi:hypothetical protein